VVMVCGGELHTWDISTPASETVALGKVHLTAMDMNEQGEIVAGTDNGRVMIINLQAASDDMRIVKQHARGEKTGDSTAAAGSAPGNVIRSIMYMKKGTVLIADQKALWEWDRNADTIKFLYRKSLDRVVPLKEDALLAWCAGNEFGWSTADLKAAPPSFRRDNAHAVAYSVATNMAAYAHGGAFANGNYLTAGPQSVELFDVGKFEAWAKADEALRQAQMELPGAKPVNRLTDEASNKDLGAWK